ncbi:cyclase family protein [Paludibaculum fermentans]|uniref:cyclase family protein n=1 Tax=Paludibaculum fermentans TaxID=1473598 RepID=UPI003EC09FDE
MKLLALIWLCATAWGQGGHIDASRFVDMSYSFDDKTIYWPTAKPFEWHKDVWGKRADGKWYSSATFTTSEHGGTHLDSPIHFGENKMAADEIPVSRLVGPAKVIDISAQCAKNRNYLLSPADIAAYEKKSGPLKAGDIVLIRTGWGRFWPNRKAYLGDDKPGDASHLSFPGIGPDAAKVFVERQVSGVGIDTASLDYGKTQDFPTHRVLNTANIYGLENVAQLERLPAQGSMVIALPVKVKGGSGGPVRIIAILP